MPVTLLKLISLDDEVYSKIKSITEKYSDFSPAQTTSGLNSTARNCKSLTINGPELNHLLFPIIQKVNFQEQWNFKLVEPNSYSVNCYDPGDFYTWHTDGNLNDKTTYLRKVSFSLGLSDNYSGGDLLVQSERTYDKSDRSITYQRYHIKEKDLLILKSDARHTVQEVTEGQRISLVGWVYGPRSWNL